MSIGELIWILVRATGLVAVATATLSVVLGLLASRAPAPGTLSSGEALDRRVLRQYTHRTAGVMTLVLIGLHIVLLLVDSYVSVSITDVLVPFTAGYDRLALGLATVATYLFVLTALSGAVRRRIAHREGAARAWRAVHLSALGAWVLALVHGLAAGTDTGAWWTSAVYAGSAGAVLLEIGRAHV